MAENIFTMDLKILFFDKWCPGLVSNIFIFIIVLMYYVYQIFMIFNLDIL